MVQKTRARNSPEVKEANRSAILNLLVQHQPSSRTRLAELTGLSMPTVSNIVAELVREDVVVEGFEEQSDQPRIGRRRQLIWLNAGSRLALAFHLGWPRAAVGLVNLAGEVIAQQALPEDLVKNPSEAALQQIAQTGRKLLSHLPDAQRARVTGAGVGIPSLPWGKIDIQTPFERILQMPVVVENNVHSMALGEYLFGRQRQHNSMGFLYVGTGIGSALLLNGELWYGQTRNAGHLIAHLRITQEAVRCRCGNTGCFEAIAGEEALAQLYRETFPQYADLNTNAAITNLVQTAPAMPTDPRMTALLREIGQRLYFGVAAISNLFNPEIIVLGGRLLELDDLILNPIREIMHERDRQGTEIVTPIESNVLGENIALVGSGTLAHVQEVFSPRFELQR